ncbi:MAG TPA: carboxypeptidase-like regulatory domain-containing protein, partial [Bryobacteraceae bacterium]
MKTIALALFLIACVALCPPAAAQVTGSLDGHITDQAGAVVPMVNITAKNVATSVERSTTTNDSGFYQIPFLPLGDYQVTASLAGFATVVAENVSITLNKTTTVNLSLRVSTVKESVTVNEAAPLIDVTSGQIRRSLEDVLTYNLPSAGRSFLGFTNLFPGFQTNPTAGQNNPTLSSGSSVSFNGTGTRGTTFLTDGVSNDDSSENQNRQAVNISTIKEMQVLT